MIWLHRHALLGIVAAMGGYAIMLEDKKQNSAPSAWSEIVSPLYAESSLLRDLCDFLRRGWRYGTAWFGNDFYTLDHALVQLRAISSWQNDQAECKTCT